MPESYIASYVGRFAPPGYPNTTSTPSALRHSMIASTARIIAARTSFPSLGGEASLPCASGRFRLYREVGEVELRAAAHADRVVQLHDLPAAGALAPELVALAPVEQRGGEPDHRHDARDQEPDEERRAFEPADDPAREREREGDDQIGHGGALDVAQRPDDAHDRDGDQGEREQHRDEADDRAEDQLDREHDDGGDDD